MPLLQQQIPPEFVILKLQHLYLLYQPVMKSELLNLLLLYYHHLLSRTSPFSVGFRPLLLLSSLTKLSLRLIWFVSRISGTFLCFHWVKCQLKNIEEKQELFQQEIHSLKSQSKETLIAFVMDFLRDFDHDIKDLKINLNSRVRSAATVLMEKVKNF